MSSKRPWMPFYVADYLADTTHLSTTEHGAYVLLMLDYWRNGGLPSDKGQLARIARMTPKEWAKMSDTIRTFFGPNWQHKRLDTEIQKAIRKSEERRKAALARHAAKHANPDAIACLDAPPIGDTLQTSDFRRQSVSPVQGNEDSIRVGNGERSPSSDDDLEDAFSAWGNA